MNIIIFGPQASGKGTQARLIEKEFKMFHMDNGKLLRKIAKKNKRIKHFLENGILVPDLEMIKIMEKHIEKVHKKFNDIIFDGFPRGIVQYRELKKWLKSKGFRIDLAIYLKISESESIKRMSARRIHKITGKVYNLITNPPPTNVKKTDLIARTDDQPESIRKRLELFHQRTVLLISVFKKEGILLELNAKRPIDDIFADIKSKIKKLYSHGH